MCSRPCWVWATVRVAAVPAMALVRRQAAVEPITVLFATADNSPAEGRDEASRPGPAACAAFKRHHVTFLIVTGATRGGRGRVAT